MLPLLLAAVTLMPGLWEERTEPGTATINGRAMPDLPVDPPSSERICLSPENAGAPASWLARDLAEACRVSRSRLAAGRVAIDLVCDRGEDGPGSASLSGRYGAKSYDIRFVTKMTNAERAMTFAGHTTARWIGACTPGKP